MQEGSKRAIVAAFLANLGIAIAKFVGFAITRSAGLLAEAFDLINTGAYGSAVDRLATLTGVAGQLSATLGALAGVPGPAGSEGLNLAPVLHGETNALRENVLTAYKRSEEHTS